MIFIQTKWMPIHFLVIFLSILLWFVVGFTITSIVTLDYEWNEIWFKLLGQGNFWLGMIIIIYVIIGKDLYLNGLQRNFDPTSAQIVQEVSVFHRKVGSFQSDHGNATQYQQTSLVDPSSDQRLLKVAI